MVKAMELTPHAAGDWSSRAVAPQGVVQGLRLALRTAVLGRIRRKGPVCH